MTDTTHVTPASPTFENVGDPLTMLFLTEQDTIDAGVTDMAACIDVMSETLAMFSAGDFRMGGPRADAQGINLKFPQTSQFPSMPLDSPDRRFTAMPAYVGGSTAMVGVKWYGSNVENRRRGWPRSIHLVVLNDPASGAPVAMMAGNLVSAYRTAAVPGVGARHLAPENASVLGLIGPGAMNTTSTEAFLIARPGIEEIRVHGRRRESSEGFISTQSARFPSVRRWIVAETAEEAVRGADIVSVAATSRSGTQNYPYLAAEWFEPGSFISLPANVRLDEEFVAGPARKVTDSLRTFESWADGLPAPTHERLGLAGMAFVDLIRAGRMPADSVVDLGDIVRGAAPAREHEDQIVLFSFAGLPVEDVAWGTKVWRTAVDTGIGTPLALWDRPFLR